MHGRVEVMALLVNHDQIDVNRVADDGETPLFVAAKNGYSEVAALLVKEGKADVI